MAEPSQQRCCVCGEEITWPVVFWRGDSPCHAKCTGYPIGSLYGFLVEAESNYAIVFADQWDCIRPGLTMKLDVGEDMMKSAKKMVPMAGWGPPEAVNPEVHPPHAGMETQRGDVDRITRSPG